MGVRRPVQETLKRLEHKTLDARFLGIVQRGLGCSAFEAEAVLEAVREVYGPYMGTAPAEMLPGKVSLMAVDADEPPGKAVAQCQQRAVVVTVHRGAADDRVMQEQGIDGWRRSRLAEVCQEALSQGALLTREDLAHRIFFVGARTISRDLAALRREQPQTVIPLRSMVQDIGPVLTHRMEIVQQALSGKTMTQICRATHHSPSAVGNYLSTFVRCAQLARQGVQPTQIAFLLRRGRGLVEQYLELARAAEQDPNQADHLAALLEVGWHEKKQAARRTRP
jgi:DNA-binding NarL/FixJ family response regulator